MAGQGLNRALRRALRKRIARELSVGLSKLPNGAVIYEGPSKLGGPEIVVIVTGLNILTGNAKMVGQRDLKGDEPRQVLQVFILVRDVRPTEAVRTGEDAAICGDCKHRGVAVLQPDGSIVWVDRTCYVNVGRSPAAVWDAYHRGNYPVVDPALLGTLLGEVPWLAYTHQWQALGAAPEWQALCMASVDSPREFFRAKAQGWRTFRSRAPEQALEEGERVCPASEEAGHLLGCGDCRDCDGNRQKVGSGVVIRLGTYGDPVAVPLWVWQALLPHAWGDRAVTKRRDVAIIVHGYAKKRAARRDRLLQEVV